MRKYALRHAMIMHKFSIKSIIELICVILRDVMCEENVF